MTNISPFTEAHQQVSTYHRQPIPVSLLYNMLTLYYCTDISAPCASQGGDAVTHSEVIEAINNAKHLAYAARVQFAQKNLAGLMKRFTEHTQSKELRSKRPDLH